MWLERVLESIDIDFNVYGFTDNTEAKFRLYKPHGSISFCYKSKKPDNWLVNSGSHTLDAELSDFTVSYSSMGENYTVNAMVPPTGNSKRQSSDWANEIRDEIDSIIVNSKDNDNLIVTGLSYWHVDRDEVDSIIDNLDSGMEACVINPYPPNALDAVMSSCFDKYKLLTQSSLVGKLH